MPVFPVAGSEKFANTADQVTPADLYSGLRLHRTAAAEDGGAIAPLTYEIVRHRLAAITEEMGEAIKRMSGSVVVTDAVDFGVSVMDEVGDAVQVGMYNAQLTASMDMAVKWTLRNRAANPGIRPGDMFICNDPWVGGGIHQNDVSLFAPLFVGDEVFAWTCAVAHQLDLGGLSPGSWSVHSTDVFAESLPIPPLKIVSGGVILADVEDSYLRRSRIPALVALDLRAKVGANNIAHTQLRRLIDRYGADAVKQVMKQVMADAETRLRTRLQQLPDGRWTATAYQDQAREGDRGLYKIAVEMTKSDDRLAFDFTGTDPQADGLINCTFAGLRGGVITGVLTQLCGAIPWAPGGLMRCIDIVSEPGTINNCTFPAGISKASVASAWATGNAVHECIASMLDAEQVEDQAQRSFMSVCKGSFGLSLLAGLDQHDHPFVTMLSDCMAGGFGARPDRDGVDTAGESPNLGGRIADVEMNEFAYPVLYLWRREELDTGGPGRFRGGVGGSTCLIPHDTALRSIHLVSCASGKALPQASGISGGYPSNAGHELIIRGSDVRSVIDRGAMPAALAEVAGDVEVVPPALETELGWDDVYFFEWQGGGGYGDPLLREPTLVAADVANGAVSAEAARTVYGVVLADDDAVDESATAVLQHNMRDQRATPTTRPTDWTRPATAIRVDDNLFISHGDVHCAHCSTVVGDAKDWLRAAVLHESPIQNSAISMPAAPELFVDNQIIFRQAVCPGCRAALLSEVVAQADPLRPKKTLLVD